ncbi:hypothetical protein CEXT_245181 [Caerostris extrusa]|uniref:Uncharacterized protein n=1 Tax=Caerostris extrusa TaxID=172846 RepID=A0AAV4XF91_CAEEX|nr:hypothetical protein CEXT_245181 [Caerostris extrusa]
MKWDSKLKKITLFSISILTGGPFSEIFSECMLIGKLGTDWRTLLSFYKRVPVFPKSYLYYMFTFHPSTPGMSLAERLATLFSSAREVAKAYIFWIQATAPLERELRHPPTRYYVPKAKLSSEFLKKLKRKK